MCRIEEWIVNWYNYLKEYQVNDAYKDFYDNMNNAYVIC